MPDYDARLEELLPRLEQLWAQLGAPIADQLAPGLTEAELSARERAAGLSLPAELRIWWGWHDGVRRLQPGTRLGLESLVGVGPWEFLSCVESLDERALMSRVAGELWQPTWLPVLAFDAHRVFVDCGQDQDGRVPVRVWDAQPDDLDRHRLPSFAALVALWVQLLEAGSVAWSDQRPVWPGGRQDLPAELLATGLV